MVAHRADVSSESVSESTDAVPGRVLLCLVRCRANCTRRNRGHDAAVTGVMWCHIHHGQEVAGLPVRIADPDKKVAGRGNSALAAARVTWGIRGDALVADCVSTACQ